MGDEKDYKATLCLPGTCFPMKANLKEKEPEFLKFWEQNRIYERMMEGAVSAEPFLFHDGPPYANGHIHHGHILNKVLKDIVVKTANMTGHRCENRPGWDCHGLPIEHAVEKVVGREKARANPSELRHRCRDYAREWVDTQRAEFKRLGVLAEWENPYLTMTHDYEAKTLREFGRFVGRGDVVLGHKPVFWCHECETALADAEVEYKEATSPSIYVKFPFADSVGERIPALKGRSGGVIIWTTTPWTLPSNLAIALDPAATYIAEDVGGDVWVMAEALREDFHARTGHPMGEVIATFEGSVLEKAACRHPFIDRDSLLIVGEHVTMETGTGCVHTAPGFGEDDYIVGARYGLEPYAPVNARGCFTSDVPEFEGRMVFSCDEDVIKLLESKGMLLGKARYAHQYPHCWRSKNPVIFRATPQWFITVDRSGLRKAALDSLESVKFIPSWGRDRITGMLKSRPDWCVSRQRHWGVPIAGTICNKCGQVDTSQDFINHVADIFESEGADAWFDRELADLVPQGWKCSACGSTDLQKVRDILDVWFDSGVSYAAVMERRYGDNVRTDLYLEGSDQHRGWFQSSLLASVGTRQQAPFRAVLTHGFVVDGNGRKLSKSEGNYIDPAKIIDRDGADVLRLWTAAEDYRDDIRLSQEILTRLVEAYRKIRNTTRFMLGVISDFDPVADAIPDSELLEQDRWALARFGEVVAKVRESYDGYEFHNVVRTILAFMVSDLSQFYLDITKDRLYCSHPAGRDRRSAQTAIYRMLDAMIRLMAPVLSFTMEEAWSHHRRMPGSPDSVLLSGLPCADAFPKEAELLADMALLREVRDVVLKNLEEKRAARDIGHPLEASVLVRVKAGGEHDRVVARFADILPELFVVSRTTVERVDSIAPDVAAEAVVTPIVGERCARCWNYFETVGSVESHPDLCTRCADVIDSIG